MTIEKSRNEQMTPIPDVVRQLRSAIGGDLTAVLGNVRTIRSVNAWETGRRSPKVKSEQTLRDSLDVVTLLAERESPQTIRSWFIGMNPDLGDKSPALTIGQDKDAVLGAARNFLAHG